MYVIGSFWRCLGKWLLRFAQFPKEGYFDVQAWNQRREKLLQNPCRSGGIAFRIESEQLGR